MEKMSHVFPFTASLVPRAFPLKNGWGGKKAVCEKLKLCVTSQRAILAVLGGLLYLFTINEKFYKVSFLSDTGYGSFFLSSDFYEADRER